MHDSDVDAAARHLLALHVGASPGARLPAALRPHDPQDGWRIQRRVGELRGRPVQGWKCGLPLADRWIVAALHGVCMAPARLRAPAGERGMARIEPELAFEFAKALPPRAEPYAEHEVEQAIGGVRLAIEVLGCRYDTPSACSGPELMADSLWHHGVLLGPKVDIHLPIAPRFLLSVEPTGDAVRTVDAAHPDGDPRRPLHWLVEFLRRQGLGIDAGASVITGSLAGVIELAFGQPVTIRFGPFGPVALTLDPL